MIDEASQIDEVVTQPIQELQSIVVIVVEEKIDQPHVLAIKIL